MVANELPRLDGEDFVRAKRALTACKVAARDAAGLVPNGAKGSVLYLERSREETVRTLLATSGVPILEAGHSRTERLLQGGNTKDLELEIERSGRNSRASGLNSCLLYRRRRECSKLR